MLSEELEAIGVEVVEELCTGPKVYNDKVRIVSADFKELYLVDNIRKLGKKGDPPDMHRTRILHAVQPVYEEWFGLTPLPKADLLQTDFLVENDFGFGNTEDNMFGDGVDMFGNPITKPDAKDAKSVEPPPPEPPSMGYTFSLDEDF